MRRLLLRGEEDNAVASRALKLNCYPSALRVDQHGDLFREDSLRVRTDSSRKPKQSLWFVLTFSTLRLSLRHHDSDDRSEKGIHVHGYHDTCVEGYVVDGNDRDRPAPITDGLLVGAL